MQEIDSQTSTTEQQPDAIDATGKLTPTSPLPAQPLGHALRDLAGLIAVVVVWSVLIAIVVR